MTSPDAIELRWHVFDDGQLAPVVRAPAWDKDGNYLGETRISYLASLPAGCADPDEAIFQLTGRRPE